MGLLSAAVAQADAFLDAGPETADRSWIRDALIQVDELPPVPEPEPQAKALFASHPRLSPDLAVLVETSRTKSLFAVEDKALELDVPYGEGYVAVALGVESPLFLGQLEKEIEAAGGVVVTRLGDTLYAHVPITGFEQLGLSDYLGYAAPQERYEPEIVESGDLVGEGVAMSLVDPLHRRGITGRGVKIGIIDRGFNRYDELVRRGELPRPAARRDFEGLFRVNSRSVHGTAVAEIIHDMAPQAQIYLAAFDGTVAQYAMAAKWLARQGVDIINASLGSSISRKDGYSSLTPVIEEVVSKDILWVNSAGNYAHLNWSGMTRDRDRNGLIDIPPHALAEELDLPPDSLLIVVRKDLKRPTTFTIGAIWDDWGERPGLPGATQDIGLLVYDVKRGRRWVADNVQRGLGPPKETIKIEARPGDLFAVRLIARRVSREVAVNVVAGGNAPISEFVPSVPNGSLNSTAASPLVLTVGAVHVTDGKPAFYSSQGPTWDGRIKPEVSAPSQVKSLAYGKGSRTGRFAGTSAASPHVAGYAALLKQIQPGYGAAELRGAVIRNVRAMGSPVPNNTTGYGRIDAANVRLARVPASPALSTSRKQERSDSRRESLEFMRPIEDLLGY
ncbi:MAG: S8 family serine peptidase [Pseudomonadota bacterium]|nr:S8 family serine peptidase [Pseudomonadota bacterium]